ncbi:putative aldo keto protein [Phaeoacremonium minimum UCRPA7]|uniref:Putative aldo keto protein n=1 Tax=Phaeoacremonium minimum (strain UCR-PA7) TaxID=1286976 RepID=R8BSP1_PHAM7|nr:putative aldo keto protein [Phaeoacremonium minimum UCRPA7]EOO02315.1 putative aldo keto protein [Phaeoacremonium minimum UCRPA7]
MAPQLVFGAGVLGMDGMEFQDRESVTKLLVTLKELGVIRLDTAARYPLFNPGKSERLLGEANAVSGEFVIDTKVYTEVGDGSGDLTRAAMEKSVTGSLERLDRPEGVNVLFAHRPDPATPLEEQVQSFQDQVARGHAKAWGVANHPPETLQKIIELCEQRSWLKPSWYQGGYSMLTRGPETRLFPILRAHGMSFLASHALASGFLTGKHIDDNGNPTGRFAQSGYAAPEVATAMKKFIAGCASKLAQVGDTVANIRRGPLPAPVVTLVDELWDAVKPIRGSMI